MRICVISDIHSNVFALEAALKEIDALRPDKIVCLGDIVGNGACPEETVSVFRRRGDIKAVKGNHDAIVLLDLSVWNNGDPRIDVFRWQSEVLSPSSKNYLARLPKAIRFEASGKEVVCFHYPIAKGGRFYPPEYLPTDEQIKAMFVREKGDIFLFGHEHTGSFHEIDGKYYLNFGSTGNLVEKNAARYGVVDILPDGKVSYELKKAYYDDNEFREKTNKMTEALKNRNRKITVV